MNIWKNAVAAGAAVAGVAALIIAAKKATRPENDTAPAVKKESSQKEVPLEYGAYSFVSGFKDAATIDVLVGYEKDRYSFYVAEDGYISDSSDSHVALISGPQAEIQIEYASYYNGETFVDLIQNVESKFSGFTSVSYGKNEGIAYVEGDVMRMCFPAGSDAFSYLLITMKQGPDNDDGLEAMPENADVKVMLSSMKVGIIR